MKKLLMVLLLLLISMQVNATTNTWTEYVGGHYNPVDWGGLVRDPGGTGRYGVWLDDNPDAPLSDQLKTDLEDVIVDHKISLNGGGFGSVKPLSRVQAHKTGIEADNGSLFRYSVYNRMTELAGLQQSENKITIQLGNEITSATAATNFHEAFGDGLLPQQNDLTTIPYYIEYYFAPAAQAITAANKNNGTDYKIMLGSIANYTNDNAIAWLEAALNYQIVGDYAPGTKGKYVYELVDTISLHYFVGSLESGYWKSALENLRDNWIGIGNISGVWSTEEVGGGGGAEGFSGVGVVRIMSRYLEWWDSNDYSSDQSRITVYGTNIGPVGNTSGDAMQAIYDFFGDVKLSQCSIKYKIDGITTNTETRIFNDASSKKKIVFLAGLAEEIDVLSTLTMLRFDTINLITATMHTFSPTEGHIVQDLSVVVVNNRYEIGLNNLSIDNNKSGFILIE